MPLLGTLGAGSRSGFDAIGTKKGDTASRALKSAQEIKTATGTTTNGTYLIDLPTVGVTQTYCLMDNTIDSGNGAWMLALKATRGNTFGWGSNYWTTINTLNPSTQLNLSDADAKFDVFNYFQAKDIMARWPDLSNGGDVGGAGGWIWLENNFNSGSRQTLIQLFNSGQRQLGRTRGSQWSGQFSSQSGFQWYGFNYSSNGGNAVRWGFAWNNEGDQNSNDVSGGIAMNRTGWSAGDSIGCCNDVGGFNRSARVEIWVR